MKKFDTSGRLRYEETFIHCWWKGNLVPIFWVANWQYLVKGETHLSHSPATAHLGIYLGGTITCVQGEISRTSPVEMFLTEERKREKEKEKKEGREGRKKT